MKYIFNFPNLRTVEDVMIYATELSILLDNLTPTGIIPLKSIEALRELIRTEKNARNNELMGILTTE